MNINRLKISVMNLLPSFVSTKICTLIGHSWQYRDYSNYMKPDGRAYEFRASRKCKRCGQNAYFYNSWTNEPKSTLDFESGKYHIGRFNMDKLKLI